ncbi:MAG: hypothetical protein JSU90_03115 [Nitrospiraceae bacterium]|nr:MAG: hypothetical protein JSU90_03115 [Nitrospiraceae bacterium]
MFYEQLFKFLNKERVDYVVVGGVAYVLHGGLRLTADLDIMIGLEKKNIRKFIHIMSELGYKPKIPVKAEDLMDPHKRMEWLKEKNMKVFSFFSSKQPVSLIDIFIYEPVNFHDVKAHALKVRLGRLSIPVASIDDLIKLKKISGRKQDLEDIKSLKRLKRYGQS